VPPPLSLSPDAELVIVANSSVGLAGKRQVAQAPSDTAVEFMLGVTVAHDGSAGTLLLGGWINNPVSLAFGRELYGFPKRYAEISATPLWPTRQPLPGDVLEVVVTERGKRAAHLSATVSSIRNAQAPSAGGRFYSWRRIPSYDGQSFAVSEVLAISSRVVLHSGAWNAVVDLEVSDWPDVSWADLVRLRRTSVNAVVSIAEREIGWAERVSPSSSALMEVLS
jgi:acetoacetate decarboxylase